MSFDGTKPNLAQTYGDAILSAQANDFDLDARVVAHVNDSSTAHGLASVLANVADYFLHKGNTTDAHGLAAVLTNVASVMAEVAAGRGSLSSLALRLAAALNADGSIRLGTLNNKWINNADTPTYISTTSFSVPGDRTAVYIAGVQCRFTISGSYAYAPVASRSFSAGVTTVVIDPAYPVLTSGVSGVDIGLIAWDNAVANSCTTNATNITSVQGQVTSLKFEQIEGWIAGKPGASALVKSFVAERAFSIPAGVTGAFARAGVFGTAAASFVLSKVSNGVAVPFGTMDFSAQHTNNLTYSEQFDNSAWFKGTGVTVSANAVTAPDGTMTADSVTYNGSGAAGGWRIYYQMPLTANGTTYTTSIWLRASSNISLQFEDNRQAVVINITTAWQRFSITSVGDGVTWLQLALYGLVGNNSAFTIYAWGAQSEASSVPTEYIPTTSSAVTRYKNEATFTASASTSFAAGDTLLITAPASQDATLADIAFNIPGVLP